MAGRCEVNWLIAQAFWISVLTATVAAIALIERRRSARINQPKE